VELDMVAQEGEEHVYAALAYLDEVTSQKITYKCYSKHYVAWQERQKLLRQGKIVSPVFRKSLYFDAIGFQTVQEKKQQFMQRVKEIFDLSYFEWLRQLYLLPNPISIEQHRMLKQQLDAFGNEKELEAFALYSAQLRLF
jgi:hypothetical protein